MRQQPRDQLLLVQLGVFIKDPFDELVIVIVTVHRHGLVLCEGIGIKAIGLVIVFLFVVQLLQMLLL
jgi:hypothetical protein